MKISKQRLAEIVKEELQLEAGGDPVGPVEAKKMAELLQNLGFTLTRGGENSLIDFLQGLEGQGDLNATPDSRRGALAEESLEARRGARMVLALSTIKQNLESFLADLPPEVASILETELGNMDQVLMRLKREFSDASANVGGSDSEGYSRVAGTRPMEEAGRPHSMRGGRTMADLDKDAKTRETDFLKKKEEEEEEKTNESKMKISKQRLAEIIQEEYNATLEEERGEPGEQPPYPSVKQDPAEVEKIADLMANDPEFEMFRRHVEKFKKYAQSGGSAVSSLESALPEYMPGQLIQKLINKVRPPGPKTPMGMPDLAGVEGDYDDPADKKKGGGYDFSKRFARTLAKEKGN